ncbi:MAG: carboxypeptidase-like regulatory domain-containing protein [Bacteroidales bacterium]|jgi:hypothetical protein|nr:carboxypeptidase-like regulatory domain-containing protein [Bacteroidales bacterium]
MMQLRNIVPIFLCTVLAVSCPFFIEAQTPPPAVSVTGIIFDEEGEPLPGVNVYVKNPMRGTSTNGDGQFTFHFPKNYQAQYLYLSSIGYHTDSVWLDDKRAMLDISLKPDVLTMDEVVVTSQVKPESEISILRKAFDRILANYPTNPVNYSVFYRETTKMMDGQYAAVAEAMLDIFKNSYNKPKDRGQIKIEKSRKNIIPQYDSIVFMYFYGGPYAFIAKDYVLTRAKLINPAHFNQFRYKKAGMTRFEGQDVYIIDFSSSKNDINGRLFINKADYAYVRIEIKTAQTIQDNGFDRSHISEAIQYIPHQGKWHLHQIKYTEYKHIHSSGIIFDCSLEHLTVQIKTDSVKTIPSRQRLLYNNPFYEMAKDYDPKYWDGYNIIQQDESLQEVLESLHSIEEINKAMTKQFDREQAEEPKKRQKK